MFQGQAKSMMFMHVSPEDSSRGETLSTLNFGSRVGQITLGQVSFELCSSSSTYKGAKIYMLQFFCYIGEQKCREGIHYGSNQQA